MDYQAALYDPIYTVTGVPCVLTLASGPSYDGLTALDKTAGVDVGDNIQVPTIKPAACFRVVELAAATPPIALNLLPRATVEMNGFAWTVTTYKLRPSPKGENDGEVLLVLASKREIESESE